MLPLCQVVAQADKVLHATVANCNMTVFFSKMARQRNTIPQRLQYVLTPTNLYIVGGAEIYT